jgi:hypothetical protein
MHTTPESRKFLEKNYLKLDEIVKDVITSMSEKLISPSSSLYPHIVFWEKNITEQEQIVVDPNDFAAQLQLECHKNTLEYFKNELQRSLKHEEKNRNRSDT